MSYRVPRVPFSMRDTVDCDQPATRSPSSSWDSPAAARTSATTAGTSTRESAPRIGAESQIQVGAMPLPSRAACRQGPQRGPWL
nr:hypothetical protein GCM10010200_077600 [Actinomadura rugatobispora]